MRKIKLKVKKNIMVLTSLLTGFFFTILIVMLIFDSNHNKFKLSKLTSLIENEDNFLSVSKYYNLNIKTTNDNIVIDISNDSISTSLSGDLDNGILTFYIPKDDPNILIKGKILYSVVDSIGQINGNNKGYVSSVLGTLDYSKMNLKNNGIEIYSDEENNIYKFKVDKKFVLGSIANIYFEKDDFLEYKDRLLGNQYVQTTKGNLIFYKINENGRNVIYFCEPNELTTRTYNSLLNLISVMYGDNMSNLFSKAYKKLDTFTWNKFNLINNYQATDDEVISNKLLDNYKILKLEIKE